jgi:hypothetical protein
MIEPSCDPAQLQRPLHQSGRSEEVSNNQTLALACLMANLLKLDI